MRVRGGILEESGSGRLDAHQREQVGTRAEDGVVFAAVALSLANERKALARLEGLEEACLEVANRRARARIPKQIKGGLWP